MINGFNFLDQGFAGASGSLDSQSMAGFNSWSGTATGDILPTRRILVSRARQLDISSPLAAASVDRMTDGVVGAGLEYTTADHSLFFDDDWYRSTTADLKRQLDLMSAARLFDAQHFMTLDQMQEMACRNWLLSGDIFFVRCTDKETGMSSWRSIESDRCISPFFVSGKVDPLSYSVTSPVTGYRIVDGVEIDDTGIPTAYWILKDYIDEPLLVTPDQIERIPAKDDDGLPLVLHIFKPFRPDQYRGVPLLSSVLQTLHSLRSYTEAELQAAIFQSAIWGFFTSKNPTEDETEALSSSYLDEKIPVNQEAVDELSEFSRMLRGDTSGQPKKAKSPALDQLQLDATPSMTAVRNRMYPAAKTLSAGQFQHLGEGEDVKFLQPTHPHQNYAAYVASQNLAVASSIGIPRQVLDCSYDGTYASARGSVLEANRKFKQLRQYFVDTFLRPIFQVFAHEYCVINGSWDPLYDSRCLALESVWQAPAALCLDPKQEIEAAKLALDMGLIDADEAAMQIYGHKAKKVRSV